MPLGRIWFRWHCTHQEKCYVRDARESCEGTSKSELGKAQAVDLGFIVTKWWCWGKVLCTGDLNFLLALKEEASPDAFLSACSDVAPKGKEEWGLKRSQQSNIKSEVWFFIKIHTLASCRDNPLGITTWLLCYIGTLHSLCLKLNWSSSSKPILWVSCPYLGEYHHFLFSCLLWRLKNHT